MYQQQYLNIVLIYLKFLIDKQLDYLKGLTELFNLQWTANKEAKTVQVEPYNEFYGSGKTLDWTHKLDRESWTDTYIVKELAQSVRFQYKEDATDKGIKKLSEWREQNSLDIYKSYTEINEARFRKETLELGTKIFNSTYRFNAYGRQPYPSQNGSTHPIAPNAYRWGDLSWTDPVVARKNPLMPVMWSTEGGHINGTYANRPEYNPRPKFGLRILNYYGERSCSSWIFVDQNGNNNLQTSYPYMDWFDGWSKSVDIDPYNLSWDDVDDGYGNNSPGLFTKYWRNAYEKMNGGAMLRTCKFALTPVDINLFDYKDKIHLKIDTGMHRLGFESIDDIENGKKELTEVELIEWKHDTSWGGKSTSSKRIQSKVEEQETYDVSLEQQVKSSIEYGITNNEREKAIQDLAQVGLTVDKNGEIQMYGGELESFNLGSISNLVYTEDTDVRKLYLQKEEGFNRLNPDNHLLLIQIIIISERKINKMADNSTTYYKFVADLKQLDSLNTKLKEAKVNLSALGKSTMAFSKQSRAIGVMTNKMNQNAAAARRMATATSRVSKRGNRMIAIFKSASIAIASAFAFRAIIGGLRGVITTFAGFESQMAAVLAISGATNKEFQKLKDSALELGKTTVFTATQVGQLQEAYARLGFTANQMNLQIYS